MRRLLRRPVVRVQTVAPVAPVAPINSYSYYLYDTGGNVVAQQFGGTSTDATGLLIIVGYLPFDLAPRQYSGAFTLNDSSGLTTSYGYPGGTPVPGGPLLITVVPD